VTGAWSHPNTQTPRLTRQKRESVVLVKPLRRLVLVVNHHGKHTKFRT